MSVLSILHYDHDDDNNDDVDRGIYSSSLFLDIVICTITTSHHHGAI